MLLAGGTPARHMPAACAQGTGSRLQRPHRMPARPVLAATPETCPACLSKKAPTRRQVQLGGGGRGWGGGGTHKPGWEGAPRRRPGWRGLPTRRSACPRSLRHPPARHARLPGQAGKGSAFWGSPRRAASLAVFHSRLPLCSTIAALPAPADPSTHAPATAPLQTRTAISGGSNTAPSSLCPSLRTASETCALLRGSAGWLGGLAGWSGAAVACCTLWAALRSHGSRMRQAPAHPADKLVHHPCQQVLA